MNIKKLNLLFIILVCISSFGIIKTNVNAVTYATVAQVRNGVTFYDSKVARQVGTMKDNGTINKTINLGDTFTIPAGYHSGSGVITASNVISSKNPATNLVAQITSENQYDTKLSFTAKPNTRYYAVGSFASTTQYGGWTSGDSTTLAVTNATVDGSFSIGQEMNRFSYYGGFKVFTFKTNKNASKETATLHLEVGTGYRQLLIFEVTY